MHGFIFGDVWLITVYSLKESLRSRRAWTIALLFLLIAVLGAWAFVSSIRLAESSVTTLTGGMVDPHAITNSPEFRKQLKRIFDGKLVDYLATLPPLGLFLAYMLPIAIPWIVALTSADLIAGDVQHRTVRYVLLRTARINYVVGKVIAQSILICGITFTSLVPTVIIANTQLASFDATATMIYLLQSSPALLAYAFGFVGLAALASQLTTTPSKALALAVALFAVLWLVGLATPTLAFDGAHPLLSLFRVLSFISPYHAKSYLLEPELSTRLMGVAMSLFFGALFTGLGFLQFSRRDV